MLKFNPSVGPKSENFKWMKCIKFNPSVGRESENFKWNVYFKICNALVLSGVILMH
jgi:hypothetical protein